MVKGEVRLEDLDRGRYTVREYQGSGGDVHIVRDDGVRPPQYAMAYKGRLVNTVIGKRSLWVKTHDEVLTLAQSFIEGMI